jgi:large repetitive protein
VSDLGLYRLLTPYFLVGFTFPEEADKYLSKLAAKDLTAVHDEAATVLTGTLEFGDAPREHANANGNGGFRWDEIEVLFRLTVPRDGAAFIDTAVGQLAPLKALLDRFAPVDLSTTTNPDGTIATVASEYPGVRFRLELLVNEMHFELGDEWRPGKLDADHRVVPDPSVTGPVRIVLPKAALVYEQTDDFQSPPKITLVPSAGGGFDAPSDVKAGDLGRMEPAIAVHQSGRVGFGFGTVVVDLDPDNTPPEILQFFGTDESFRGIYVQSARLYYADKGKDIAVNAAVKDLLISFEGKVSFDASVDVLGPQTTLSAQLAIVDEGKNVEVSPGEKVGATITGGKVRFSTAAEVQVDVTGGVPPVTISVKADAAAAELYAGGSVTVTGLTGGVHKLSLLVTDATTPPQTFLEEVEATVVPAAAAPTPAGAPADRPAQPGDLPAVTTSGGTSADGKRGVTHAGTVTGTTEQFRVFGPGTPTVTVGGAPVTLVDGLVTVDVKEATTALEIVATWPALAAVPQEFQLFFSKGWPHKDTFLVEKPAYLSDLIADPIYEQVRPGQTQPGTEGLHAWLFQVTAGGAPPAVAADAYASFETNDQLEQDQALSERRLDVAVSAIDALATISAQAAHGHTQAHGSNLAQDRVVKLTATTTQPAATETLTVARAARPAGPGTEVVQKPVDPPKPLPQKPPGVFRRVGVRVKVIRNEPVLIELSGELDFETDLEKSLRNPAGQPALPAGGSLGLKQQTAAVAPVSNPNPKDGVVDFRITVVHDPATHAWTEVLAIGAHPDDVNGLLQMTNPHAGAPGGAETALKDLLGSVMIFAPIIGEAVGATDPNSAGSYAVLGGAIVGAGAIGAAGFVKTEKATLYGGELRFREFVPPGENPARFADAGVLFDYGVEFGVEISALGIKTTKPLKVRYRAIGFNLNFTGPGGGPGQGYQPIFDTSKGFELDLSDPGLFKLPAPIDNVLKVLGARIAKVNPLTVEMDLGMKVDLGVVRIDRFKVKVQVDPFGLSIIPSGISVDIAKVLVGSGYVNIIEPPAPPAGAPSSGHVDGAFGGIEGAFDVSLVPVKLRIAASFGIRPVTSDDGTRHATAVFLGLIIDLPAPIPLAQSGVGIYGFAGLFAMHYKRLESDPDPTDAIGPALLWLVKADGEPAKLVNSHSESLWGPELDRWSFGVGLMLGTMEGGFLVNLRGMFVLELPGPRILIFVKVLIVKALPDLKPAADLIIGILAVVDLDFQRGTFTIGLIVDIEVKNLVEVKVPVEMFANFKNADDWHLYIGTFGSPASAMVLNIVRGFGYVMIAGKDIDNWPGYGETRTLRGIAMATGFGGGIVFGDESVGLFVKVILRADIAVTFSPSLHLVGRAQLDGELRLFVVSIGAHGLFDVEAPDPTHVKGEICGHVDLFFFSVEGCVKVETGSPPPALAPPHIVRNVWLQSHAPVITAGQGGDRPIDASLGDALAVGAAGTPPVVPIDAVPVIQFSVTPTVDPALTTFTKPLVTAPGLPPGGFVDVGAGPKVSYALVGLRLDGPAPAPGTPVATWRPDTATTPTGGKTNIDLALMSNVPLMGARALERSAEMDAVIDGIWGRVCDPIAPPAAVLWTFCRQLLGPSGSGWSLTGHAWPDPAGTARDVPVDLAMRVEEPERSAADLLADAVLGHTPSGRLEAARVIGPNGGTGDPGDTGGGEPGGDPGSRRCAVLADRLRDGDPNPALVLKTFRVTVLDPAGNPFPAVRTSGIGAVRGLDVGSRTVLDLVAPTTAVILTLVSFAQDATLAAFEQDGSIAMEAVAHGTPAQPDTVVLSGRSITRVVIEAPADETVLIEVCVQLSSGLIGRPALPLPLPLPAAPIGIVRRPAGGPVRVPGAGVVAMDPACMRALQLPERQLPGGKGELKLSAPLKKAAAQQPDDRWVDLVTGGLEEARLFLAVAARLYAADAVVIEQLDAAGALITKDPLSALAPVTVSGATTGLPADWLDPAGPWLAEVGPAAALLAEPALVTLQRVWVTVRPDPATVRLRIRVEGATKAPDHPAVVLAVAEVLTAGEAQRATTEEASRSGQVQTLAGYLDGSALVPLLAPGQAYTLHIDYVPTVEGAAASPKVTESFSFTTDNEPPKRLDPYVLATAPRQEEQFVFADDTIEIVFNDLQAVQMYKRYGRTLTAVLRGADGIAIPAHEVKDISEVPAVYSSPLYDSLDAKIKGGAFPCIGAYHREGHGAFTLPEQLRPSMAYTLDIEAQPVPAPPAPAAGQPARPVLPLFRRQFRTGVFRNLGELVDDLKASSLEHRPLTGPISGLAAGEASDLAIEAALLAAGLPALGPARKSRRIVLWRPLGTRFVPHALLLDTSEPLWRVREAPTEEVVPNADPSLPPDDPAYKRIIPGLEASLRLEAAAPVTGFVRAPSGTRTVVLLADASWPTAGATVLVEAVRPAATLYAFAEERRTVTQLPLGGTAPWEDDHG